MAQPSVAQYFSNRKRSANEDLKINSVRKVLILGDDAPNKFERTISSDGSKMCEIVKTPKITTNVEKPKKTVRVTKSHKPPKLENAQSIKTFISNMKVPERCVTPPNPVEKVDKELINIKKKLLKSSKLSELKESIKNFKNLSGQLAAAEKRTNDVSQSPKLKTFKSIEFEVPISPQKVPSPEKPYLSPRKEPSVRKNLLSVLSPTKNVSSSLLETHAKDSDSTIKQGLKLPYKYRTLAEIFRAIDTITQILHNRKEVITLKKLKPAVEQMLKRNLNEKHLAQIKRIYPNAYEYRQEKLRQFGSKHEEWNLVLTPNINESMTPDILLERRRKLFDALIDLVKDYHNEFLLSLTPPMIIAKDKITRWHPEFDLEKVPEIEQAEIPQPPAEEKLTTGKEVLERARQMFNCNTRMEEALARLKAKKDLEEESPIQEKPTQNESVLKGIPKALLEKVRQKQAAKALMSMTRSADKDKEILLYSRLPEIARLIRNLFVTEKKSVLQLDTVIDKLGNSYRCPLTKIELEDHLKTIAVEAPEFLVFHKVRNAVYLKLAKNADLSKILIKLEKLAKDKSES